LFTVLVNLALAILKFTVGHLAHSRALIADAFNSAGDVLATSVAWIAFRYGSAPPDEDHPYGHGNAEALAGLLIGGMICATGAFITIDGIQAQLGTSDELVVPDRTALWAAGITIAVKLGLFVLATRVGRKDNSPTLLASARDHRADVVTGSVALIGIWLAQLGMPQFDAVAGIVIGIYIFWLGLDPVRANLDILMLREPPELGARAREIAASVSDVHSVREVRVQPHGGRYRMDLVLLVDRELSVHDAHEVAHVVEDRIRAQVAHVTEVYVHVEPDSALDDGHVHE
jgi:cation diffusion facilitator family transporter